MGLQHHSDYYFGESTCYWIIFLLFHHSKCSYIILLSIPPLLNKNLIDIVKSEKLNKMNSFKYDYNLTNTIIIKYNCKVKTVTVT